jgi:ubiquitin-protein ligase/Mg-chelatase subunit ChlD
MSAKSSLVSFSPPSLALDQGDGAPDVVANSLFFPADVSAPSRSLTPDTLYVYNPVHAVTRGAREGLDPLAVIGTTQIPLQHALEWTLAYCSLRQLSSLVAADPSVIPILMENVCKICPFPPLLAALGDFLSAGSFDAHVMRHPLYHFWLLQDFLFAVGRAMLPLLVPDEIVLRRPNFVLAKLLHAGKSAAADAPLAGAAATPPTGDNGMQRLTLAELEKITGELLGQHATLSAFNVLPTEAFCPVTSNGLVLLSHGGAAFVANHAASTGSESVLHGPPVRMPPANPNAKNPARLALIADAATLRDLDVAHHHAADQPDNRITQLDVIVVDCSGSMGARAFASDEQMSRADAAQIMFNMAVDKYRSMEITARTACVLFGSDVQLACPFTSDLTEFETLLGRAESMGQTRLWDAVGTALEALIAEHAQLAAAGRLHPDCRSRILAMTDGLDNASTMRPVQAARYCRTHRVVLDAFVLGAVDDTDLRTVAAATGGLTLAFRDMDDAMELFERPFVVNVALRPERQLPPVGPTRESMRGFADLAQYPRVTSDTARELSTVRRAAPLVAPTTVTPSQAPPPATSTTTPSGPGTVPAPTGGSTGLTRRMAVELRALQTGGKAQGIVSIDSTNTMALKMVIKGLPDGVYANSFLLVEVTVPAEYPFRAPKVTVKSTIYHPQVNTGDVCDPTRSSWSPSQSITTAVAAVRTLLDKPDLDSAINTAAANMYRDNRTQYDTNVAALLPALTEAAARGTSTSWNDCP